MLNGSLFVGLQPTVIASRAPHLRPAHQIMHSTNCLTGDARVHDSLNHRRMSMRAFAQMSKSGISWSDTCKEMTVRCKPTKIALTRAFRARPTHSAQSRRYLLAMPHFSKNAVMSYIKMKSRPRPYHRKFDFFVRLLLEEVMAKRRFARLSSLTSS